MLSQFEFGVSLWHHWSLSFFRLVRFLLLLVSGAAALAQCVLILIIASIAMAIALYEEQEAVFSLVLSACDVFFSRSAGNGKSVVIRTLRKELAADDDGITFAAMFCR